ncbi:guanylate-binding family protein [Actinidia rufa]|uniref:Guanylate-binding family protein n=1 Tax=Actinidia rufa TaxID=165716 RepID=A0A7J0E023_9ERIC|nr:guanylate-binding family protein [Actinidia rufa]
MCHKLLGRSSGFQVPSTHRPCTKGLWLWSAPIRRTSLDGTEYNLLLLDSEGIDAYDQTVLDNLVSKYEASTQGPEKWRKLTLFFMHSLEVLILDLIKKQMDQIGSEKSSLVLKCRSIEDKMGLLSKQLEASEKYKSEYLKRHEDAINDKKKLADDYMSRITNLQSKCSSLEVRSSSLSKTLDAARQESLDWKRKLEQVLSRRKAEEDQATAEIAILKSKSSPAEARLAAREQSQSAQEEAEEWKRKYDIAVREAKAALKKAAVVQERSNKQTQQREDTLRAEFSDSLAEKHEVGMEWDTRSCSVVLTHVNMIPCAIRSRDGGGSSSSSSCGGASNGSHGGRSGDVRGCSDRIVLLSQRYITMIQKLKQELTKHNFGAELLQLRNPNKKDIISLYERCVLQKS